METSIEGLRDVRITSRREVKGWVAMGDAVVVATEQSVRVDTSAYVHRDTAERAARALLENRKVCATESEEDRRMVEGVFFEPGGHRFCICGTWFPVRNVTHVICVHDHAVRVGLLNTPSRVIDFDRVDGYCGDIRVDADEMVALFERMPGADELGVVYDDNTTTPGPHVAWARVRLDTPQTPPPATPRGGGANANANASEFPRVCVLM